MAIEGLLDNSFLGTLSPEEQRYVTNTIFAEPRGTLKMSIHEQCSSAKSGPTENLVTQYTPMGSVRSKVTLSKPFLRQLERRTKKRNQYLLFLRGYVRG